jgi:putative drug exporter of the RND superfamily
MTVVDAAVRVSAPALEHSEAVGPIGRLGRWAADHVRAIAIAWAILAVGLGLFAPKVESALSGAGWQANGSESVQARTLIERNFAGLASSALMVVVHSQQLTASDNGFRQTVARVEHVLRANSHVRSVVPPRAGSSISADGHTAVVMAGANGDPTAMVAAADTLKSRLKDAGTPAISVSLTGASGMWSDFDTANRNAMLKSEVFSWPVTMAILVLAFGAPRRRRAAAAADDPRPRRLGRTARAAHTRLRDLDLGDELRAHLRARARDRLRALHRPSPAFRSMALGIMLSVLFVLAATLTLLPAVLSKLGPKVDALPLRWVHSGEHRSARFARWGERLWRHPHLYGPAATLILVLLTLPIIGLKTGMPSIKVVPSHDGSRVGYTQVQQAFGAGAPGALQIVAPKRDAPPSRP